MAQAEKKLQMIAFLLSLEVESRSVTLLFYPFVIFMIVIILHNSGDENGLEPLPRKSFNQAPITQVASDQLLCFHS